MTDENKSPGTGLQLVLKRLFNWDVLWVAIVIPVIISLIFSSEARNTLSSDVHSVWVMRIFYVALLIGIAVAIVRTLNLDELKRKNRELSDANQRLSNEIDKRNAKEPDRRWDTYARVIYGHIEYDPFLNYVDGNPTGLGLELLTTLLDKRGAPPIQVHPYDAKGNWATIFDGLAEHKYDIVATPLFATFERSKSVRFTSPLFFSNIGFYVSEGVANLPLWKDINVDHLREVIAKVPQLSPLASSLDLLAIEGEISYDLASNYADLNAIDKLHPDTMLPTLFPRIQLETNPYRGLFCESFLAQRHPLVKSGKVVNVLKSHSILYPVCFAVRLGDYHLINLLNIRLLDYTKKSGALEQLVYRLAMRSGFTESQVKEHFVAEWPCAIEAEQSRETAHA